MIGKILPDLFTALSSVKKILLNVVNDREESTASGVGSGVNTVRTRNALYESSCPGVRMNEGGKSVNISPPERWKPAARAKKMESFRKAIAEEMCSKESCSSNSN